MNDRTDRCVKKLTCEKSNNNTKYYKHIFDILKIKGKKVFSKVLYQDDKKRKIQKDRK